MIKVTQAANQGFLKWAEDHMSRVRELAAAELTATVADRLLEETPVENGHAHTAWIKAFDDVAAALPTQGVVVDTGTNRHVHKQGRDRSATKYGHGSAQHRKNVTKIRFANKLGYVSTLEHGGSITPISPGGKKEHGLKGPGPLFGKRARVGTGMLLFRPGENPNARTAGVAVQTPDGGWFWTRKMELTAGNYLANAMNAARAEARRRGVQNVT